MTRAAVAAMRRAQRLAAWRAESMYRGGADDSLAVIRLMAEQATNRAAFLGTLDWFAESVAEQYRAHPGPYTLGRYESVRDFAH